MQRITTVIEMRGIPREEFTRYFKELGGISCDNETYKSFNWEISIGTEVPCRIGKLVIQSVKISLSIEEGQNEEMLKKFRMHFMRGGA